MAISPNAVCDEFVIATCPEEASKVQVQILEVLTACGFGQRQLFAAQLAVEEAVVNAIKHGNAGDTSKDIRIAFRVDEEEFAIDVEDQGDGFSPDDIPDPTLPDNISRPCGRGIMLMHSFMTSVEYNSLGNKVRMTLRR